MKIPFAIALVLISGALTSPALADAEKLALGTLSTRVDGLQQGAMIAIAKQPRYCRVYERNDDGAWILDESSRVPEAMCAAIDAGKHPAYKRGPTILGERVNSFDDVATANEATCVRKQLAAFGEALTGESRRKLVGRGVTELRALVLRQPAMWTEAPGTTKAYRSGALSAFVSVSADGTCTIAKKDVLQRAFEALGHSAYGAFGFSLVIDTATWTAETGKDSLRLENKIATKIEIKPIACKGVDSEDLIERFHKEVVRNTRGRNQVSLIYEEAGGRYAFSRDDFYLAVIPHPDRDPHHFLLVTAFYDLTGSNRTIGALLNTLAPLDGGSRAKAYATDDASCGLRG